MSIGEYIKQQRKLREWTLEDLSSRSGISKSEISRIENDKVDMTLGTLQSIALAFDVSAIDILAKSWI